MRCQPGKLLCRLIESTRVTRVRGLWTVLTFRGLGSHSVTLNFLYSCKRLSKCHWESLLIWVYRVITSSQILSERFKSTTDFEKCTVIARNTKTKYNVSFVTFLILFTTSFTGALNVTVLLLYNKTFQGQINYFLLVSWLFVTTPFRNKTHYDL